MRISMFKRTRTEGRASQSHESHEPQVAQVNIRAGFFLLIAFESEITVRGVL